MSPGKDTIRLVRDRPRTYKVLSDSQNKRDPMRLELVQFPQEITLLSVVTAWKRKYLLIERNQVTVMFF